MHSGSTAHDSSSATGANPSRTPRSSSKVTRSHGPDQRAQRTPPQGAIRVDVSGKTVIPAFIDGHNHIGLVDVRDGSNSKTNYTRENLVDQLERYAYLRRGGCAEHGARGRSGARVSPARRVDPECGAFSDSRERDRRNTDGGPYRRSSVQEFRTAPRLQRRAAKLFRQLHSRGVRFVKIWVDDRDGTVPKLQPDVYRAIITEAHANGQQVLAHLGRTSGWKTPRICSGPASTDSCTRCATGMLTRNISTS